MDKWLKLTNKKVILNLIEYTLESLILYFCFTISGPHINSFARYFFAYITFIFILGRAYSVSTLIWTEAKHVVTFYLCFCIIAITMQPLHNLQYITAIRIVIFMGTACFLTMLMKKIVRTLLFQKLSYNTLIIGTGHHAQQLSLVCRGNRFAMSKVIGYIDCNNFFEGFSQEVVVDPKQGIYPFEDLNQVIQDLRVNSVIIAIPQASKEISTYISDAISDQVELVKFLPRVNNMIAYNSTIEDYDSLLVVTNSVRFNFRFGLIVKRLMDILAGIVGCILLVPMTIILKICYMASGDYGKLFFVQERIGRHGKKIRILKFRSMIENAEQVLEELMEKDPKIKEEYLLNKKLENDPRITKVGKFIRKTSLDEFPQFVNILIGQMSLVGPRPYLFREKEDMGPYYKNIIKVTPGITGMWQVSGRSNLTFIYRLKLDTYYVKNWSFWMDFIIVIKTFKAILSKDGAM